MSTFSISLLTVFLFGAAIVSAQQKPMTLGNVKMTYLGVLPFNRNVNNSQPKYVAFFIPRATDSFKSKTTPNSISSNYYTEHLGMMCKEELKLEKAIKFPVRIRLGSKDQVDYLEGKYNRH